VNRRDEIAKPAIAGGLSKYKADYFFVGFLAFFAGAFFVLQGIVSLR